MEYAPDTLDHTLYGFIEALQILQKCMGDPNPKYFIQGEHDAVYCRTQNNRPLSESDDGKRLASLSWFYDEECESWAYFT